MLDQSRPQAPAPREHPVRASKSAWLAVALMPVGAILGWAIFRATSRPDSLVNLPAAIIWCTAPAVGTWLSIRAAISGNRVAILAALISAFFLIILLIATPGVLY